MTNATKMSEDQAATKADKLLELLIQHQPGLFSHGILHTDQTAERAAKALATVRATLIAELQKQPV